MSKIFISATSADLSKARKVAEEGLRVVNYDTVEQSTFETDYGKMLERIRRKLHECDAIVHIAGFRYGAEPDPATLPPGTPRRSYTQWEYHIAKEIQKKRKHFRIYAFLTADDYPTSAPPEAPELAQLQLEHRALLNPIKAGKISNNNQLREKCKEIQLEVEKLRRRNQLLLITQASLLIPIVVIALGGGLNQYACQAPGIHSICKQYGWGGVPRPDQETDFRDAVSHGCDGLRQYALREDAPLALRQRAEQALNSKQTRTVRTARRFRHPGLKLFVGEMNRDGTDTPESALEKAQAELLEKSAETCNLYIMADDYEAVSEGPIFSIQAAAHRCAFRPGRGHVCSIDATVICNLNRITEQTEEICNVSLP